MMSLTRKQFELLEAFAEANTSLTQRDLMDETKYSLGTINKTMKEFKINQKNKMIFLYLI